MQERSFLVQVLLNMATGGGAKLEPLIVDKAGIFDAGLNKGYNPVTVASGDTSVLAKKGAVSNHEVIITPEARVTAGWQDGKSVTGEGIGVSASELVSGTYNVSQAGNADVTNYRNVSVKSGRTTAQVEKETVDAHTVRFTPKATITEGWQDNTTATGDSVDVNAGELVSGTYPVTESGEFDVSAYEKISVPSGVVTASATKGIVAGHTVTVTPKASRTAGFINSGETEGLGVNVTASELVSGTLNVSQSGTQDVTNYENISVPIGGHSASATKGAVSNHSVSVTPKSTATAGFVSSDSVNGTPVSVSASELVSGRLSVSQNGIIDVTNYKEIEVSGVMIKESFGSISATDVGFAPSSREPINLPTFPNPNNLNVLDYAGFLFVYTVTRTRGNDTTFIRTGFRINPQYTGIYVNNPGIQTSVPGDSNEPITLSIIALPNYIESDRLFIRATADDGSISNPISSLTSQVWFNKANNYFNISGEMFGLKF